MIVDIRGPKARMQSMASEADMNLVLTVKVGESVVIETDRGPVRVIVQRSTGEKVQLGINAPREIPVHRGERQTQIQQSR